MQELISMPDIDMDTTLIVSALALIVSVVGWVVAYLLNIRARRIGVAADFRLKVYEGLLGKTNELIQEISAYTAGILSHTNSMASLLNDYEKSKIINKQNDFLDLSTPHELKLAWLSAARDMTEQSFSVQRTIESYLRYLDMNGTDYTDGTEVYDALQQLKNEANQAAQRNRDRWNDPSEMDQITETEYSVKSQETKNDADVVFDFGMCVDDVLLHVYNASIAEYLGKPKKLLEMKDKRRYITLEGIVDKRETQ